MPANMSNITRFPSQLGYGTRMPKPSPTIQKGGYSSGKTLKPLEAAHNSPAAFSGVASGTAGQATAPHIDPAYLVGGVAAAGLGAATLASAYTNEEKKQHTALDEITGAVDGVVGGISTAATIVNFATLPVMLGGLVLPIVGLPTMATSALGWKAPEKGFKVAQAGLERAMTYKVSEFGQDLNKMMGSDVAGSFARGSQKMADTAAGVLAPVGRAASKVPGLRGLHPDNIRNIPQSLSGTSLAHTAMNAAMLTSSATSLYGVARDFGGQLAALRQLAADIEGKKLSEVTSYHVLMGDVPKPVAEARSKLLSLSGIHALADMASMGVILNSHRMGMMLGMLAWSAPEQIHTLGAGFIGESVLPLYKGLRDAQAAGQQLPTEALAELVLAANSQLRDRGRTGKSFAAELANQYFSEGTKVAVIIAEASNGEMKKRIDAITEAHKKPATPAAPEVAAAAEAAPAPAALSHVERLQQKPQAPLQTVARPEVGAFTSKVNQQAALAAEKSTTQAI